MIVKRRLLYGGVTARFSYDKGKGPLRQCEQLASNLRGSQSLRGSQTLRQPRTEILRVLLRDLIRNREGL
jgi:hypothetical protein